MLLVRHGITPTTGRELPVAGPGPNLSEEGVSQAGAAAEYIANLGKAVPPPSAIYCSPMARTRDTAGVIAARLGLAVVEEPALADCDTGEWAGTPLAQLARKPEWPVVVHYPSGFNFPGGEPFAAMRERAVGAIRAIVGRHPGSTVVVVSHADPLKAILADALGSHFDLFQRIVVSPASVSTVSYAPSGPMVVTTNWTAPAQARSHP